MANKYKKFVASAATATLVASAIVPVASANETVKFSDVKDSSEFAPFIYDLAEKKVMSGAAGKFNPAGEVTRSAAVKTLGKWLVNVHGKEIPADYNTVQRFTDLPVDYKDQELLQYAALVKDLGVFTGAAGKLNPTGTLNREQMAKVVVEAYSVVEGVKIVELVADFESSLTDLDKVSASNVDYVKVFEKYGITTVDTFNPKGKIQRQHFAKFLSLAINGEELAADTAVLVEEKEKEDQTTEDTATVDLTAVEAAVAALPKVEEVTKDSAEAATKAVEAVTAAVAAAKTAIAATQLTEEAKATAEAKLAEAEAAAKAVADKVAEVTAVVVTETISAVVAEGENIVKATITSEVKEEELVGKVLTLVEGETTLTATYVEKSLNAKGEAQFKLAADTKLVDAKTYATSAEWATIENGEFLAKVAPVKVAKFEKVSTAVIAEIKDDAAANNTINVAAFNQYGEKMTDTEGTTVTGKLNGMTLVSGSEISYSASKVTVTKDLAEGDVLEFTLTKKDGDKVVVENTFSYTVIKGEKGSVQTIALNPSKTSVPAGEEITFETDIRDQYNNSTTSVLRWVVNGEVKSTTADTFVLNTNTPGEYTVEVFSTENTKVSAKTTVTVGAALLTKIEKATVAEAEKLTETTSLLNNETSIIGFVKANEGAVLLAENIKFDVTTTSKDVTKEDIKVVAEKLTLKDGKTEVIAIKATSSKPGVFTVKPFVGTAVDAKDVIVGDEISVTSTVNQKVTSISKVSFDAKELKVNSEVKKEIVVKNTHNEVLNTSNVQVTSSNPAVKATVETDVETGKTYLVVKATDAVSASLTVTANNDKEVFDVYTVKFVASEIKSIDKIADVTGLVAKDQETTLKALTFKDQDGTAVETTKDVTVVVTDELGKAIADEKASEAPEVKLVSVKEVTKDGKKELTTADSSVINGLQFKAGTKAGVYNVEVVYGEGDKAVKSTFKVTVGEERAVKSLEVKASSTTAVVGNSVDYTVTAVDQYGKKFDLNAGDVKVTENAGYTVTSKDAAEAVVFTVTGKEAKSYPLTFTYGTEKPVTVASSLKVLEAEDAIKAIEINKEVVNDEAKLSSDNLIQLSTENDTTFKLSVTAKDAAGEVVTINQATDVFYSVVENNLVDADKKSVEAKIVNGNLVVTKSDKSVEGTVKVKATSVTGAVSEITLKLSNAAEKAAKGTFYFTSSANGLGTDKDGNSIVLPAFGTVGFADEEGKSTTEATIYVVGISQYNNVVAVDTTSALDVKLTNSKTANATVDGNKITLTAKAAGTVTLNVFQGGEIVATTTVNVSEEAGKAAQAK